jgi:hypothetical protein
MKADDIQSQRKLKQAGIDRLILDRQEISTKMKVLRLEKEVIDARIMKAMVTSGVETVQAGVYRATLVSDSTYEHFDRDEYVRYLVQHGVNPKLLNEAEKRAVEVRKKAPHLRVSGGEE